jgi:hypothetical protein
VRSVHVVEKELRGTHVGYEGRCMRGLSEKA